MASQAFVHYERGLRLLSIDGGRIRGLSTLFLLRQILHRLQREKQLSDLPRPCDVFDLAGGTSTGGLIVIMLFRLQMSIDDAIHTYTTLAEKMFLPKNLGGYEDIDVSPGLVESMASIISQRSSENPMLINMVKEDGSKCFISAMPSGDAKGPTLFRSWYHVDQHYSTIVQAAWATTWTPLLFNVVEHDNPVKYVVEEAKSLFAGRPISCVLSLGTGTAEVIGLEQPDAFQNLLPQNLIGLLKDIADECEKQSNAMEMQLHQDDNPDIYFRLNVDEGLQNVSLAEWDVLNEVEAHTLRYVERPDVEQKVDRLVQILKGEPEPTSSPLPAFRSPPAAKEDVDLVSSTRPEPSSITLPLYRLPATSTEDNYIVPFAAPQPSSIAVPLHRLPLTSISEDDGVVPSAVPEPLSIKTPLSRLPATSPPEGDDFVPSAVPESSSITFPLSGLPATSTSAGDGDDFVPSVVPEPSSILVPLDRFTATAEEGDLVPSLVATESPSVIVPLIRLSASGDDEPPLIPVSLHRPVSTSLEDDSFVPFAAPESSSITLPLYRQGPTSLEDGDLVPSAVPEPSSIKVPLDRSTGITSVEGDDAVPSSVLQTLSIMDPLHKLPESASGEGDDHVLSTELELSSTTLAPAASTSTAGGDGKTSYGLPETILDTAKISPPTELSTSENEAYSKLWERCSESLEGSPSSICLDGTCKEEIEAIMRWIEGDGVKKPLFLVLGQPGTGKTTLLNTISQRSKAGGYYAASYFFSRTDHARNTPERLINTITYQIAEAIPEIRPYVARTIEAEPGILDRSIEVQTQRLLVEPLLQLKTDHPGFSVRPHVIIIDALEECGELNDQTRVITALTKVLEQEHVPLLCLLSCGFNLPIAHEVSIGHAARIHDQVILGKTIRRRRR